MIPKDLAEKYQRNSGTIIGKLQDIGIYKNTRYRFTKEDIEFLREHYPLGHMDLILERFPKASKQTIFTVCSKHKIRSKYYYDTKWTQGELDIIRKYYFEKSPEELSEMMNSRHSCDAITTKASKYFGYSKDRSWSDEEKAILRKYYSTEPIERVIKRLPKRTYESIVAYANLLGVKSYHTLNTYWNKADKQFILNNWQIMSDKEMACILGKEVRSVSEKRWNMGLLHFHHYNQATYENLMKYIRGNIGSWKTDSMKICNYRCVLTGSKDFEIHHIYSFSSIFAETIEENNIDLKDNFCDYTADELSFIVGKFIEKQNKYPLGVCVRKDIHAQFHKEYGKIATPEMWYEFETKYKEKNRTK